MALIDRWNALSNDGRAYMKFSAFLLYVYIYNRMPFYKSAKLLYCGMGSYIFISTYVLVTKLFFKRDNTPLLFIGMGIWQFFSYMVYVTFILKIPWPRFDISNEYKFWFRKYKEKTYSSLMTIFCCNLFVLDDKGLILKLLYVTCSRR